MKHSTEFRLEMLNRSTQITQVSYHYYNTLRAAIADAREFVTHGDARTALVQHVGSAGEVEPVPMFVAVSATNKVDVLLDAGLNADVLVLPRAK